MGGWRRDQTAADQTFQHLSAGAERGAIVSVRAAGFGRLGDGDEERLFGVGQGGGFVAARTPSRLPP